NKQLLCQTVFPALFFELLPQKKHRKNLPLPISDLFQKGISNPHSPFRKSGFWGIRFWCVFSNFPVPIVKILVYCSLLFLFLIYQSLKVSFFTSGSLRCAAQGSRVLFSVMASGKILIALYATFSTTRNNFGLLNTTPAALNAILRLKSTSLFFIITLRQSIICSAMLMCTGQTSVHEPHKDE